MEGDISDQTIKTGYFQGTYSRHTKLAFWIALGLILAICLIDIIGWITGIEWFKSFGYYWIPMSKIVALCFIVTSFPLYLLFTKRPESLQKNVPFFSGIFLIIVSLLTIISWINSGSGQEASFSTYPVLSLFLSSDQRMPFLAAIIFFTLGVILILLIFDNPIVSNISHILLFPVTIAGYLIPVSYVLDFYTIHDFYKSPVALNSGIAFCAVSVLLILIRQDTWLMKVFVSKGMGGIMARKLFPWLFLFPIAVGWLRISGETAGYFDSGTGVLLVALTYTFSFILLVWFTARSLNIIDNKHQNADEALRRSNSELENRIRERTAELSKLNQILDAEIKERILAEKLVAYERKRIDGLLELIPAYLILLTPDRHVTYSNRYFRERFGTSSGKRCFEFLFNRSEPCEVCETFKVMEDNLPHTWEWVGPDKRIYSIFDFPYSDSDGSPLIMEMGIDISDLKNAEARLVALNNELEQKVSERTRDLESSNYKLNQELLERHQAEVSLKNSETRLKELNNTKDKIFNIIAHDLKNPFTCLIGTTEVLNENIHKIEINKVKELVQILNDSAKNGFEILQNLLDWSRSQTGLINYDPEKINLRKIIELNISGVRLTAERKEISILNRVKDEISLVADKKMLNAVLRNLLGNAVKFTYKTGIIEVDAKVNGAEVEVSVKDNGMGIPEENIMELFRIDSLFTKQGTNNEHGTGLGLKISKEFIERHGGRIWVKSTLNEGSEFVFTIPG